MESSSYEDAAPPRFCLDNPKNPLYRPESTANPEKKRSLLLFFLFPREYKARFAVFTVMKV